MIASSQELKREERFEKVANLLPPAYARAILEQMFRIAENPEEMHKRQLLYTENLPSHTLDERREFQLFNELVKLPTWVNVDKGIVQELIVALQKPETTGGGETQRELSVDFALIRFVVKKAITVFKRITVELRSHEGYKPYAFQLASAWSTILGYQEGMINNSLMLSMQRNAIGSELLLTKNELSEFIKSDDKNEPLNKLVAYVDELLLWLGARRIPA